MPWTREEKYFVSQLIWEPNHSKLSKQNFCRKSNFNNNLQKSEIYRWFQATGSVNKKAENPRSDRKLTARCPNNMDAVRGSVWRSPKKSNQTTRAEIDWLYLQSTWKTKFLGTFLEGLFWTPSDRTSRRVYTVRTYCNFFINWFVILYE